MPSLDAHNLYDSLRWAKKCHGLLAHLQLGMVDQARPELPQTPEAHVRIPNQGGAILIDVGGAGGDDGEAMSCHSSESGSVTCARVRTRASRRGVEENGEQKIEALLRPSPFEQHERAGERGNGGWGGVGIR